MQINSSDASGLNAVVRGERRRVALANVESASFIDAPTVARLRRDLFPDGFVERHDAEALFAVERREVATCPEWRDFLVETIVEHVLWQQRPTGALKEKQAAWLLAQADRTRTVTAFMILLTVLDEAQTLPRWFAPAVRSRAENGWPGLEIAAAA